MQNPSRILTCLLLLGAQAAWAGKKAAPPPAKAPEGSALVEELKTTGVDKKHFEAYVKLRIAKINERHKARMDFMDKEGQTWSSFWTKVRDERKIFEIRVTRQTLDLFESLASLDRNDHDATISDFERMQANVIKSFEAGQKQKLSEFFAAREQRWKDFVSKQERERTDFLSEAAGDWQRVRGNPSFSGTPGGEAAGGEEERPPQDKPAGEDN